MQLTSEPPGSAAPAVHKLARSLRLAAFVVEADNLPVPELRVGHDEAHPREQLPGHLASSSAPSQGQTSGVCGTNIAPRTGALVGRSPCCTAVLKPISSGTASNRGLRGVKQRLFNAGGSVWKRGFWYSRRWSITLLTSAGMRFRSNGMNRLQPPPALPLFDHR